MHKNQDWRSWRETSTVAQKWREGEVTDRSDDRQAGGGMGLVNQEAQRQPHGRMPPPPSHPEQGHGLASWGTPSGRAELCLLGMRYWARGGGLQTVPERSPSVRQAGLVEAASEG